MYSAAAIAVGLGTTVPMDTVISPPTITQIMLSNSEFKLKAPKKITRELDKILHFLFHMK